MNEAPKQNRRVARAIVVGWFALLFGVFFLDLVTPPQKPFEWIFGRGSKLLRNGTVCRRLDQWLVERRSFVFTRLRPVFSLGLYKLTGQVRTATGLGKEGWLYHEWELQDKGSDGRKATKQALKNLVRTRDLLKSRNIELVLAIVPNKTRIYPEYYYLSGKMPESQKTPYSQFIKDLQKEGMHALDLEELFLQARKEGKLKDLLYYTGDNHWSDTGCFLACEAITKKVRELHPEWCDRKGSRVKMSEPTFGDSCDMLYLMLGFPKGVLRERFVRDSYCLDVDADSRFTEKERLESPFILTGDSFAATRAHMGAYMEYGLQAPVLDVSKGGGKSNASLELWFEMGGLKEQRPRLMIWECWEASVLQNTLDQLEGLCEEYGKL